MRIGHPLRNKTRMVICYWAFNFDISLDADNVIVLAYLTKWEAYKIFLNYLTVKSNYNYISTYSYKLRKDRVKLNDILFSKLWLLDRLDGSIG